MFEINETVVHPNAGICKICDIKFERFKTVCDKYYVLSPLYSTVETKIYVPVSGNKITLRYPLSKEELIFALENSLKIADQWIDNDKLRAEKFNSILKEKEPSSIIEMICELHKKRKEREKAGRKLRSNDERILSEAEKLVNREFAFVLDISPDDVPGFIMKKLNISD